MIVYGDHEAVVNVAELTARLRHRVAHPLSGELEEARFILIAAGQIEQAVCDAGLAVARRYENLTLAAAELFLDVCAGRGLARRLLDAMLGGIEAPQCAVRLRTPEGFAWYGLLPEAYASSAERWDKAHANERGSVLVIGLRSIGTALSALVAAVLRRKGWWVDRVTARPSGPVFARELTISRATSPADYAIVVDEGPGLSGSSMASAARWLSERGFDCGRIAFFAGHANGPGGAGDEETRRWWRSIRAEATVPCDVMLPGGVCLPELMRLEAERMLGEPVPDLRDISAGKWRKLFPGRDEDPSVAPPLEQPKWLAAGASGRRLAWKFAGLAIAAKEPGPGLTSGCEQLISRHRRLADLGLSPAPLASRHGWAALPWLEGRILLRADATPATIARIARQIEAASQPPLLRDDAAAALDRLRRMLSGNAGELLGASYGGIADRAAALIQDEANALRLPSYGDGRMAPREWIEMPGGRIMKVDAGGHEEDHTCIGRQSILWDVAGAIVEWDLGDEPALLLSQRVCPVISAGTVAFYSAAYAAFRAGIAMHCDGARSAAVAYYERRLRRELGFLASQEQRGTANAVERSSRQR